jgi:hypothetical protein
VQQGVAVLVLMAAWGTWGADATGTPTNEPAAIINQHEVSREEFQWFLQQERGAVFRVFNTASNAENGAAFRHKEQSGTTPRLMLQSNTLARVVREKVEQILFRELRLMPDISYAGFLSQLDRVNQEREQAARRGQVIYGPVRYNQLQFYEHRKATLRAQAIERLAAQSRPPSEAELRKFYTQHLDLFRASPTYTVEVVTIKGNPAAGNSAEAMQTVASNILVHISAGATLTNLLRARAEGGAVSVSAQRLEETSADHLGELCSNDQQLARVLALAPGEAVCLRETAMEVRVVGCRGKTPGGPRSYDAVQRQVRERRQEQQYDQHLGQLVRQAEVKTNQAVIDELIR